jgi:8-oxo-dGTP pyrophosphatase MutT (NUDIX family)
MMDRFELIRLLSEYKPYNANEKVMVEETVTFVQAHENCFQRELLSGHVTGSAWIINREGTHVLMMHHKKIDRWFQPGGHCDGDPDVQAVARKEALEETGVEVEAAGTGIFDVDVHVIPARKEVPEHKHYDIRFLFSAVMAEENLANNEEANAVKWIPLGEVHLYNDSESIMRMVAKNQEARG